MFRAAANDNRQLSDDTGTKVSHARLLSPESLVGPTSGGRHRDGPLETMDVSPEARYLSDAWIHIQPSTNMQPRSPRARCPFAPNIRRSSSV